MLCLNPVREYTVFSRTSYLELGRKDRGMGRQGDEKGKEETSALPFQVIILSTPP